MAVQLAAAITSFVISFLIVPVIIKFSLQKNLVDIPGRRKIHKKVTPSMGGIAIFVGFAISSLIWIDLQGWAHIKFILVALFVIFFIGVRDDLVPLRATAKLMGQIMAASLVIFLFDLRIKSFYGLFGIDELSEFASVSLTFFTIIVITNSFNLIDGLDGLAGTIAIIALLAFGIWFFLTEDYIFSILSFAMLGSIFAFLIFNWEPSEVFMGDTGALVIGMTLAIMAIHFIDANNRLYSASEYKFTASIGTAACFIIIPLVDTLRIVILRLSKRQSPFKPDKSHIHHAIMRLGMTHAQTTLILGAIQILFICLSVIFNGFSDFEVIVGVIILAVILSITLDRMILGRLVTKESEE
jgi:UDP-N-acetylmuramyl pentapeptide phosphotransferase/UDP-N-acetylglucosamine-1-phosphate transferase